MSPPPGNFRRLVGTRPLAGFVSLVLLPVLFALDRQLPPGAAAGIAYVLPVLLTLWAPRRLTLAVAGIASVLVLADPLLAPVGAVNWMAVFNRVLALLMVWVTVTFVLLRRRAEAAVAAASAALERKVEARTTHLDEANRRLRASELKYRALLENAVDAIVLAGPDGRLMDVNHRAEQLLGYSREELRGMHARDLHPPEEHARVAEVFETLRRSGSTLQLHPVRRKGGSIIQVEVAASRIEAGGQILLQGIFRDVSTRERRAAKRLAEEQQLRDTLVREVHHRIKNNLQGVVGLLRSHAAVDPRLDDAILGAIGQVQSISLVHGLHGEGNDPQVRLCDMVCAIARNVGTLTRTHIEPLLEPAALRTVAIDPEEAVSVALVVNELILNAVKHSTEDPQVLVRVARTGAGAEVTVTNTGTLVPGFDFAAGRGTGTGLGLVHSLLPRSGAGLQVGPAGGAVVARLVLAPPVVITPGGP